MPTPPADTATPLQRIEAALESHATIIAKVTGIDVEIVDANLIRVAGTGHYAQGVGQSLARAGEVYTEVMRTKTTIFINNCRYHSICMRCPDREQCTEILSISTPILHGDTVLGVIGLVCFNPDERERIIASSDSYIHFITLLSEALAHQLEERSQLDNASRLLDLMLQVVHVNNQGIIVLDSRQRITYANALAREQLQMAEVPTQPISLQGTGDNVSDYDEFELKLPDGSEHRIIGQHVSLQSTLTSHASVLVFDLPSRLALRLGNLTVNSDSGLKVLVGQSAKLIKLKDTIRSVAQSSSTVLITGESGTGKELVARAIHQESSRRDNPFVAINCGGIPDTLLESELFGYVGGAFTGASRKGHMGKFELAQGGVLFLDEISNMPLYLQVKLLRVLQERTITRLGSNRDIKVDIRIIAASNQDLRTCIAQKTFRNDLFYRLNVIPLETPPLRERVEDIPILAEHFLHKYCALFHKAIPKLSGHILDLLAVYPWPGNVRELEHVMEYAVNMMPEHGRLRREHLPWQFATPTLPAAPDKSHTAATLEAGTGGPPPPRTDTIVPMRELEKQAIEHALGVYAKDPQCKVKAAKALGMSLATLYRKIGIFSI